MLSFAGITGTVDGAAARRLLDRNRRDRALAQDADKAAA